MDNSIVFEVKQYMIIWRQMEMRDFDGVDAKIRAIVRCTGTEYKMDVFFLTEDSPFPQPAYFPDEKKGYMFMPVGDILAFVDMLRNEKPIFAHLRGDRPEWTSVTTSNEAVGEGETG